tara:strand:+ start:3104 stop:3778 length:675 start_codon:yes stop_codon:yes gene_type:complete
MSKIIIALDLDRKRALELAKELDPSLCKLKVGSELFTSSGPEIIEELKKLGFDIFLDLKFHDIPNTVASAVKVACNLGIWMTNVHASGGKQMMMSAVQALNKDIRPILIGVTVLTSIGKIEAKNININTIEDHALSLAVLAKDSGLDGVVCSPKEVKKIKEICGKDFIAVTPGIRLGNSEDDQNRVSSPKQAIQNGSDFLVIGRPITKSNQPLKTLDSIIKGLN